MKYQFFTIPVHSFEISQQELNSFCSGHRVATVEKQFVANGDASFWTVCVTYLDGNEKQAASQRSRVDYKEVLNEKDFTIFAILRNLRKTLAEKEGVPAYALFTNEQLATMVRRRITEITDLSSIGGVGKARLEKYGGAFLSVLRKEFGHDKSDKDGFQVKNETYKN